MSAVTGLLGLGGGASGTSAPPPQLANLGWSTNNAQLTDAYRGNNSALQQQQALLTALQGQGGLNNQSQVYGQLQNVAAGRGPNPAAAMLSNATGQNTANQAALMAGQRGAASNVGLIARQAAQQGAANQQNAIGQAAALQAQQSLGALGQAGALANTQAAQQIGATGQNTAAQQAEQQSLLNAQAQFNNAQVSNQASVNGANAALATEQQRGQQGLIGGVLGGVGSALGLADGGSVPTIPVIGTQQQKPGMLSQFLTATAPVAGGQMNGQVNPLTTGLTKLGAGIGHVINGASAQQSLQMPTTGMLLPASNQEVPASDQEALLAACGGKIARMAEGGTATEHTPSSPEETEVLLAPESREQTGQHVQFSSPESVETVGPDGKVHDYDPSTLPPDLVIPQTAGPVPSTYMSHEAAAQVPQPQSTVGKILNRLFAPPVSTPGPARAPAAAADVLLKALGGETDVGSKLKKGGHVPGTPKVPGPVNSYANDTVNAKLSPGEIVLPRTVTQSKDPVRASAEFVARTLAAKKYRGKK